MQFECPSCFMKWKDSRSPKDEFHVILCSFCGSPHQEFDLLNWQMDHLENIDIEKHQYVIRNFFRYVTNRMSIFEEKLYEHSSSCQKEEKKDKT